MNKSNNVLLINPSTVLPLVPPIGLEYVAETLFRNGYTVDYLDATVEDNYLLVLRQKLRKNPYILIGISIRNIDDTISYLQNFYLPETKELVSYIRKYCNTPIIVGGSGFNIQPVDILEYVHADIGVAGIGLSTVLGVVKQIEAGNVVPSRVYYDHNCDDLNWSFERRFIDYDFYKSKGAFVGVNTKCGCPLHCIYCTYPLLNRGRLAQRNPELVVNEIERVVRRGIRSIYFADSVFNIPMYHAKAICEEILRRKINIKWHCFINPSMAHFDKELVRLMKRSGCFIVNIGIDSGSHIILEELNKDFTKDEIVGAANICENLQVNYTFDLLFGSPSETGATIKETFGLVDRLNPIFVGVTCGIRIYRNTTLGGMAIEGGIIDQNDKALAPVYYPFDLTSCVEEQTFQRNCCRISRRIANIYSSVSNMEREKAKR